MLTLLGCEVGVNFRQRRPQSSFVHKRQEGNAFKIRAHIVELNIFVCHNRVIRKSWLNFFRIDESDGSLCDHSFALTAL